MAEPNSQVSATSDNDVLTEASRRRTFAVISHPDAGKTTLTEKFLLYGGALSGAAGAVKARGERRSARSDWMEMEQSRGISITSSAMSFPYRGCHINLLDTPGHRDFSEDTYRVLSACDAAVMVLDAAKGIEPQTLKLFEVCRDRGLPILSFINKWDRPGLEAFEVLEDIDRQLGLIPTPVTWPVGIAGDFRGLIDCASREYTKFTRTAGGSKIAPEELFDSQSARDIEGDAWDTALTEVELLGESGQVHDTEAFLEGVTTPTFFGSAITNFGVGALLKAITELVPRPADPVDIDGRPRPLESSMSGFVFKVQANMDKAHRDRIAFLRVMTGHFERGMVLTHERSGKPFATKYAHQVFGQDRETVDDAYPGDVVGLVNAADVRVGDTLFDGPAVRYPPLPTFAPEHFQVIRVSDTSKFKQFRKGLAQLDEEGVVQVLRDKDIGDQAPLLAAVGPMQFEVATWRLESEFKAPVMLEPTRFSVARRTDESSAQRLRPMSGVAIYERSNGELLALFESPYWLERLLGDYPDLMLEPLLADGELHRDSR